MLLVSAGFWGNPEANIQELSAPGCFPLRYFWALKFRALQTERETCTLLPQKTLQCHLVCWFIFCGYWNDRVCKEGWRWRGGENRLPLGRSLCVCGLSCFSCVCALSTIIQFVLNLINLFTERNFFTLDYFWFLEQMWELVLCWPWDWNKPVTDKKRGQVEGKDVGKFAFSCKTGGNKGN